MGRKSNRNGSAANSNRPKIHVAKELDLHGLTIEAALGQVQRLVSGHQYPSGSVIRLIHGHSNRGDDSIKTQLHRLLQGQLSPFLQDYYLEPFNPGSTLIVLEGA